MRFATDLGAREGGLYHASFDDGLRDIFCGSVLTLMGVAWIFEPGRRDARRAKAAEKAKRKAAKNAQKSGEMEAGGE